MVEMNGIRQRRTNKQFIGWLISEPIIWHLSNRCFCVVLNFADHQNLWPGVFAIKTFKRCMDSSYFQLTAFPDAVKSTQAVQGSFTFKDSQRHYRVLDGLRGVAAVTVVMFHLLKPFPAGITQSKLSIMATWQWISFLCFQVLWLDMRTMTAGIKWVYKAFLNAVWYGFIQGSS